jgi:hypothetical protein
MLPQPGITITKYRPYDAGAALSTAAKPSPEQKQIQLTINGSMTSKRIRFCDISTL